MRDIIIILGKTGYGKSTWLSRYCEGHKRIFAFDPFAKFPCEYATEEKLLHLEENGGYAADFKIGTHNRNDLDLIGALSFIHGDCLLVIEECGFIWNKGERIPDWLQEIVFLGRHKNVSLAVTAQRAAYIPIDLRSQANRLISFWQTELTDVDWLENYLGADVENISTLPRFFCLDAEDGKVNKYKISPG